MLGVDDLYVDRERLYLAACGSTKALTQVCLPSSGQWCNRRPSAMSGTTVVRLTIR